MMEQKNYDSPTKSPVIQEIIMSNKIGAITVLLSKRLNIPNVQALKLFYNSQTCQKLHDKSTGLYLSGDLYFVDGSKGEVVVDQKKYVWKGNGILPEAEYEFGADGKMLDGFVTKADGLYYYENGKPGRVGLNYIDGYYYFVDYSGKLTVNKTQYIWATNGLTIEMNYRFDELGRAVL